MKKYALIPALLICICTFNSCGNSGDKDKTNVSLSDVKDAVDAVSSDDSQKRIEELKKLTPVSNDVLKAFFPEEVMGMKRSSFNVTNVTGYAIGTAEYKKDDTTNATVAIYDCAGDAGSAFYGMTYLTKLSIESEDENGYSKTVDFMGTKAIETYSKSNHQYTLNFLTGERFFVTLEGENTELDNIKSFANGLNLDKLKDLK